ncbi:MAG: KR domain-containing protein [Candidatus Hydrogenedentes bacterium]|nr:KR domain-containing protein [Candidatus Hydrogenedentota bacterium]
MGSDGQSESQFAARGVDEIRAWLTRRLAEELGISPGDIAPGEPFESFGLASRDAVTLSGDLEDWLQRKLSPTLLWEYPTIIALADYLGKASAQPEPVCAPSREAREGERVAIIGIGCRFPGASSPEALWRLLHDGVDAITEVPAERWDVRQYYDPSPGTPGKMCTKWGGFLENIDQFDPQFFNISPREAARMDPQQRLLLETSWEALERAGLAPDGLAGSATGVFVGISAADYAQLQFGEPQRIDAYAGSGNALSIAANRISYALDLRGPSVALDTACSSSMVAVHWACRSLLSGECALALAGGVNLTLAPETTITFSQARMMALDGRCKTFDAGADGYVRGEGCGIVVLKQLSEAVRDGDPIIAVIRGTAINHDGRSNGLTAPNGLAQQAVVRAALTDAGAAPFEIGYVEAHGTGTSLGDPIEVDSLKAALLEGRSTGDRCALGSIKTNIGHLEAAAGIAGLIKAALSLCHEEIPPHLHLKTLNPLIEIESTPFWIPVEPTPWRRGTRARLAGVSAFGFGGTNAHAILEEAPALDGAQRGTPSRPPVLCLSAHTEEALRALAQDYSAFLRDRPDIDLGALCFTASLGRNHFARRLGVVASSREAALEQLERTGRGESRTETAVGDAARGVKPKIAFLFTGQGAQYPGMGRRLYESEPVFRGALDRCAEILRPHMTGSLLDTMYASTADDTAIHMTANSQPALFALEYALAELWRSWGVVPDAVLGHSLGEYVAACVAGAFTLEEGLALVARRAQLMQALPPDGTMVAALASSDKVLAALEGYGGRVSVAAINGSEHTVLSGGKTDLAALTTQLEGEGVSIRPMSVSHAFHSRLIEPILDDLDEALGKVAYRPLQIPLVSNRTGAILEPGYVLDASYWRGHARETVQFQSCMSALIGQRFDTFVEIGPHPVLAGMGRRCAPENFGAWLPSLRKDREDGETLAHSVAQLYVRGAAIDWRAYYHGYAPRRVAAPTYPFQRRRYWFDVSAARHGSGIPALESAPPFEAEREPVAACRYGLEWRRRDRIHRETNGVGKREHGTWLVFSDTAGVGDAVAAVLRERGGTCVLVTHSGKVAAQEPFRRFLDPAQSDGYGALIDEVLSAVQLPLCGVIHLWSLDAPEPQCGVVDSLARAHALSCESVLHILHALEPRSHAIAPHPRLWVVTRGVQPAGPSRTPLSLAQSPVWGLGRSAALEFPQIWGGLIDVDATGAANAAAICAEALEPDGEEQAAFRDGLRYVARVTPRDRSSAAPAVFRADGTYLITGGFGDLGLLCAQWMAERGARRIVLTGRTALPARTHWDSVTDVVARHAITAVQGLEACGVSVIIAQADAADRGRMAEVFDDLARTMPPLRGIIHAAGTVQPLLLHDVDAAVLSAAMRPKVEGAWVLHELSRSAPLDFFVLYSSISSVWGSKGLAHYAAANHFLDTLAHHRRALGLVATSVNWGPWAGSSGEAEHHSLLTRMGLTPLTNGRGLTLLDEIAGSDAAQEIAAAVDWPAFKRVYEIAAPRPHDIGAWTGF